MRRGTVFGFGNVSRDSAVTMRLVGVERCLASALSRANPPSPCSLSAWDVVWLQRCLARIHRHHAACLRGTVFGFGNVSRDSTVTMQLACVGRCLDSAMSRANPPSNRRSKNVEGQLIEARRKISPLLPRVKRCRIQCVVPRNIVCLQLSSFLVLGHVIVLPRE
jgi:hypothetical protein